MVDTYSSLEWVHCKVDIDTALQMLTGGVTCPEVGGDVLDPQV